MSNQNVNKGRAAENAAARVLVEAGMAGAERRTKRGGTVVLLCEQCAFTGFDGAVFTETDAGHRVGTVCPDCDGTGQVSVPADAGDLTGIPGVVVQVKWSGYKPLAEDMRRTDEQRRVAGADVGLLVRKRKGVGCARAGEWDAYLPGWQLARLMSAGHIVAPPSDPDAPWRTDLATAARLLAQAGYGTPIPA